MSFLLFQTPDPHTLKSALPDFTNASHIFLPINDCRNVMEAEGGTHWSLLLVSLVDGLAFHYDSLPPGNATEASEVTAKISKLCDKAIKYVHMRDAPTQENSSDCGVFVCITMRYLLKHRLLQANSGEYVTMALDGVPLDASTARKEMLQIIHRLKREKDQRRSYVTSSVTPIAAHSLVAPRAPIASIEPDAVTTPNTLNAPMAPMDTIPPVAATGANHRNPWFSLFTCFFTCALFIALIGVAISFYCPNVDIIAVYHGYAQRPVYRGFEDLDSFFASAHSLLFAFAAQGNAQLQELLENGRRYITKACDAFAHLRRI
ncbi:Ulp1 protease family protein [Arthroderma uncinatum]|uniref:Ulp1 protease family protein n=1 Tax=Arthroderma uncinatum TaxID=74035 RepID=UPI00144ACCC3|nr:Ulp1 protease family protein [Arthroderma uncinatum]KAF3481823.1 Ulp1 protease family protein [Arthroderma uncinatum]